jgi:hypothetical protein
VRYRDKHPILRATLKARSPPSRATLRLCPWAPSQRAPFRSGVPQPWSHVRPAQPPASGPLHCWGYDGANGKATLIRGIRAERRPRREHSEIERCVGAAGVGVVTGRARGRVARTCAREPPRTQR